MGIGTTIISLGKVYYDLEHVAGFSSVAKLVKAGKSNKADVEKLFSGQDKYTLNKHVRKWFSRIPYIVTNIDDIWEMDLSDLSYLTKNNDKRKYLLNVIDIFLRYACSETLKNKTGTSILAVLKSSLHNRKQMMKQSENCNYPAVLETLGNMFSYKSQPRHKGGFVERFNRTLKTKVCKYFTNNNTYSYLEIINKLQTGYNNYAFRNRYASEQSQSLQQLPRLGKSE